MARRLPSTPPVLPGFNHVHILGSGGFADVFLYEQNMPRRQVAVKVLLSEIVNESVRQMFQAEANLMAQLSSHPSILTVYQASVSSDGRPYLVMEMCSSALSERYRRELIPVAEVLRIAVRIGSAIETAHRAGVLHRDIKPSNILLTAYGHPVLSDFGIAATLGGAEVTEAVGMSIPWSAPEVLLDESNGAVASEVWSFAATVYSLLAGRSPFEVPGQANKSAELIARIDKAKVQPIARPDVPAGLERSLQRAMSRNPAQRHLSVLELVHELQAVETELGLAQTPVEVAMDDWALATVSDLEDRTRVRGVSGSSTSRPSRRRRRSSSAAARGGSGSNRGSGSARGSASARASGSARGSGSARASGSAQWSDDPADQTTGSRKRPPTTKGIRALVWGLVATAVLVVGLAAVATFVLVRSNLQEVPVVTDITAQQRGTSIEFSWPDPGLRADDSYQIDIADGETSIQRTSTFIIDGEEGSRVCLTVSVNRGGVSGPASNEKCAQFSP